MNTIYSPSNIERIGIKVQISLNTYSLHKDKDRILFSLPINNILSLSYTKVYRLNIIISYVVKDIKSSKICKT